MCNDPELTFLQLCDWVWGIPSIRTWSLENWSRGMTSAISTCHYLLESSRCLAKGCYYIVLKGRMDILMGFHILGQREILVPGALEDRLTSIADSSYFSLPVLVWNLPFLWAACFASPLRLASQQVGHRTGPLSGQLIGWVQNVQKAHLLAMVAPAPMWKGYEKEGKKLVCGLQRSFIEIYCMYPELVWLHLCCTVTEWLQSQMQRVMPVKMVGPASLHRKNTIKSR